MASFTDAISQFNPYVQQLSVDTMAKVGMYKQQQYDQGVQKVQSYIDNVSGLGVSEKHKSYLQSKLNQLGNNLKYVAAGDFSNQQVVNSVGGMASQVGNDPIIQTGVYSAKMISKGISDIERAKKDGKSAPENEDAFTKSLTEWTQNKDLKQKFQGEYDEYFDWQKHLKDQFNDLKPDGFTAEQIFETDSLGKIKHDPKTGKPIYSPTMTHLESEGIFPERVRAALDQVMSDPRVSKQLDITGKYTFRGLDNEALARATQDQGRSAMTNLYLERDNLNLRKSAGHDVTPQLLNLESNINKSLEYYSNLTESALTGSNLEGVRSSLYSQQVRNNYTSINSAFKNKSTNMDNPGWKANMELTKEANLASRFYQDLTFKIKSHNEDLDEKRKDRESREKIALMKNGTGADPNAVDILNAGRKPRQGDQDSGIDPINYTEDEYKASANNFKNKADNFLFATVFARNPKNAEKIQGFVDAGRTEEEAKSLMIDNAAKLAGMDPIDYRTSLNDAGVREYNKLTPKEQTKNKVFAANYQDYITAKSDFDYQSLLRKGDNNIVSKIIGEEGMKALSTNKIKPIKTMVDGKPSEVSAENIYDLALYGNANKTYFGFVLDPAVRQAGKAAEERLIKEGKGYLLTEAINAATRLTKDPITRLGRVITNDLFKIGKEVIVGGKYRNTGVVGLIPTKFPELGQPLIDAMRMIDNDVLSKARTTMTQVVRQRHNILPNQQMPVFTGNNDHDRALLINLKSILGSTITRGANESVDVQGIADQMIPITDVTHMKGGITFNFKPVPGSTTPEVEVVFDASVGRAGGITITKDQALTLGVNIDRMFESKETKQVRETLNNRGGKTSVGDWDNEKKIFNNDDVIFRKKDFPNLKNYNDKDVKANIITSSDGTSFGMFYTKDNEGVIKKIQVGPYTDVNALVENMKRVFPQTIDKIQ